eukprot:1002160-Pelagomonas_calceolata.AAC.2
MCELPHSGVVHGQLESRVANVAYYGICYSSQDRDAWRACVGLANPAGEAECHCITVCTASCWP